MDGNGRLGSGRLFAGLSLPAAIIVAGCVALAACGGAETSSSSPSSGSSLSSPSATAATVALTTGEVATCLVGATPDEPGPADQPRPRLDAPGGVAMDSQSGRVVAFDADSRTTWTFDVCTNTWRRTRPVREPMMGRCRMVYDADADLTVAFPEGGNPTPWAYSVEANTWRQLSATDSSPRTFEALNDLVYDPTSGRVLVRDSQTTELWGYAVETNTWTHVEQGGGANVPTENPDQSAGLPHFHSLLSYDTVAERLILTLLGDLPQGGRTWAFDVRFSAWAEEEGTPPRLNTGYFESGGEVVFDEARGVTVVFSDGVLATYDPAADEWTKVEPGPGWPPVEGSSWKPPADPWEGPLARLGHWLVYDPVNERIVMLGGHARMPEESGSSNVVWKDLNGVWAYDLSSNRWVELVPARPR